MSSAPTTPARFLDPELLGRIGSLELLARAVVEGFMSGLHRSPFTGFSTEFTEYRQYNPGDDLRYLDWRLLGRTDRYFIKKYRADTNTQCHLLIDTSASMNYAHASSVTKLQYAQFLAASLAYLLNRQQDAVGLVAFAEKVHSHVPARNRTGHMRTIFGNLSLLQAGGETHLAESLHQLAEILTRRGIVVIVGLGGGRVPFGFAAVPHEARFLTSVWGSRAQLDQKVAHRLCHRVVGDALHEAVVIGRAQTGSEAAQRAAHVLPHVARRSGGRWGGRARVHLRFR